MRKEFNFSIPYCAYLDEKGNTIGDTPSTALDFDYLKRFYKTMVLTRTFDQKVIALQRTGQMGTYPSCLGQEAIGTAIGLLMSSDDVFVPYYRDQATQLLRGVTMVDLMRYWGGEERGSLFHGDAKEDFPNCVPIATQITHAAGVATAFKVRKEHRAVVTTCGEGATSRGDFMESVNVAGAWQLPLVIVVNNNQWAISVPRKAQTRAETIAQKAISAGIEGIQVDGNDPLALSEALESALNKAHSNKGATLIEAVSYRLSDHTTADDATRYRSAEELNQGWEREPVKRLRSYLHHQNQWNEEQETQWQDHCQTVVKQAVEDYLATPNEAPESIFDYLYEELPAELWEQREHVKQKATQSSTTH